MNKAEDNFEVTRGHQRASGNDPSAPNSRGAESTSVEKGGATAATGGRKLHGNPRYVKGQGRRGRYDKSSAMSDTSEAPSIASHVKRVRVPSQVKQSQQVSFKHAMPIYCQNKNTLYLIGL